MAHFMAGIRGRRGGEVTRVGDKHSGMTAFVNGWNVGVDITIHYNAEKDRDEIEVVKTGGSNGGGPCSNFVYRITEPNKH